MIRKLLLGTASLSLVAAPAMAAPAANPAQSLSVAGASRAGTPAAHKNGIGGVSLIPALLAAAVIAGGIIVIVDNDDDRPDSN